jgi:hypothetical protein
MAGLKRNFNRGITALSDDSVGTGLVTYYSGKLQEGDANNALCGIPL